jgi:hypothetical protein
MRKSSLRAGGLRTLKSRAPFSGMAWVDLLGNAKGIKCSTGPESGKSHKLQERAWGARQSHALRRSSCSTGLNCQCAISRFNSIEDRRRRRRRRNYPPAVARAVWSGCSCAAGSPGPPGRVAGIQPAAGSLTTPGWYRSAHARAGKVVLGLVYRSAGPNIPAAQYHGPAVVWAAARGGGVVPNSLGGLERGNQDVNHLYPNCQFAKRQT